MCNKRDHEGNHVAHDEIDHNDNKRPKTSGEIEHIVEDGIKKYICSIDGCNFKSLRKDSTVRHQITHNDNTSPTQFVPTTLPFICDRCGPKMGKNPDEIHGGLWCPNCPIEENRPLTRKGGGYPVFVKSMASFDPVKMARWITDKNEYHPIFLSLGLGKKVWFNCAECGHDFDMRISHVVKNNSWCPYCSQYNKLCDDKECLTCHKKSFASMELSDDLTWMTEMNNGKTRRQVSRSSGTKYFFQCSKCKHILKKTPNHFFDGYICGFCSGKIRCENVKNCAFCLKNTAVSIDPEKLKYMVKQPGDPELHTLARTSRFKFTFICPNGHKFKMDLHTIYRRHSWCTKCRMVNKNMHAIEKKAKSYDNLKYVTEKSVKINKRTLFWDMVVEHDGTTFHIESDGPQHFSLKEMTRIMRTKNQSIGLRSFKDQRIRDLSKEKYIRDTGGLLFRVSYRQLHQIPTLFNEMIEQSSRGIKGVVYMDSIYTNWVEI